MRTSSEYPFGSRLGPAVTLPRQLPRPPESIPLAPLPLAVAAQPIRIIDWTAVGWAAFELVFYGFFGFAGIGSATGLSALLLLSASVALVVLLQKLAGVVFDVSRGTLRFYSFWLPREVAFDEIRDANCEFAMTLSPSRIALALFAGNSKGQHRQEFARQRTYSVNLSGSFGSRQLRFYAKRWRDHFLSELRDVAPGCSITRWH